MKAEDRTTQRRRFSVDYRVKLILLATLILVAVLVAYTADLPDPNSLRSWVDGAGRWGPVLFVLFYAAMTATPFPASALTVASGLLFGLAVGVLVAIIGATVGAWIAYWMARSVGRRSVAQIEWSKVRTLNQMLERRGLWSVLLVRLIPVFPFAVVNYAAGLSSVRQRDYLIGTAVGIIPAAVGLAALGAYGTSPLSWPFAAAVAAVVLISVGSGYLARRLGLTRSAADSGTGIDGDAGHVPA